MKRAEELKSQIREAFAGAKYPGYDNLLGSNMGDEPFRVQSAFLGKDRWQSLEPEFIDRAPNGLGSALSFFSHEAFRFYLPAYLLADIDQALQRVNPVFHLIHGLDDQTRSESINPVLYGERTWMDESQDRFSGFTKTEAAAIVAYLKFKRESSEFDQESIDQALHNYWHSRASLGR